MLSQRLAHQGFVLHCMLYIYNFNRLHGYVHVEIFNLFVTFYLQLSNIIKKHLYRSFNVKWADGPQTLSVFLLAVN